MKRETKAQAGEVLLRLVARGEQLDRQLAAALSRQGLSPRAQTILPQLGQSLPAARVSEILQAFESQLPSCAQSYEELCRPSLSALASEHRGVLLRC